MFDIGDTRQGIVQLGITVVCPDSLTCTLDALGALAWGIGSSEAEHALPTVPPRVERPKAMRITIDDQLAHGVVANDVALRLSSRIGASGARGMSVEYAGAVVRAMDIDARMTLCNMTTKMGGIGAVVAPDAKVIAWLAGRPHSPEGELWAQVCAPWQGLCSDPAATFERDLWFDVAEIAAMVT